MTEAGDGERNTEPPAKHPLAEQLEQAPESGVSREVTLTGLFGGATPVEGGVRWRLYLSARLDSYAEFMHADVVHRETVEVDWPAAHFNDATRVTLRRGAAVSFSYSHSESLLAGDQFDLDVRMDAATSPPKPPPTSLTCPRTMVAYSPLDVASPGRTMTPTVGCTLRCPTKPHGGQH